MTIYQFEGLDDPTKTRLLWNRGTHIATRDDHVYQYLLYQLDGFYVEVLYHIEMESLFRLKTFVDTDQLAPYLEMIDIGELYRC